MVFCPYPPGAGRRKSATISGFMCSRRKKTHHFPPSLVPGSSLKLSYISILYYTIYTPTLNIPQNTALPFQHLKGFVILAFFSVKQQVLTGHVVEAAACMPQVD